MNLFDHLPETIRSLRLFKGLSQENVADLLGISTSAYGDIERGKTEITLVRLSAIAQIFEIPVKELLKTDSEPAVDVNWLQRENSRLLRENVELQFRNELLQARLNQLLATDKERQRIGF